MAQGRLAGGGGGLLALMAKAAAAKSRAVLAAFALLTIAAAALAAALLGVNTDSSAMLSPGLDFRQREAALNAAFPGQRNQIVVVIRAPTAEQADAFSARLVAAMQSHDAVLGEPFAPAVDPFFMRNGLLYLETDELDSILAQTSQAAPLLGALAADPSLDAFFNALADGLNGARYLEGAEAALDRALIETARVIDARIVKSAPEPLAFSRLFEAPEKGYVQRIVTVHANSLDFHAANPAKAAIAAVRASVAEAQAGPYAGDVTVGVTGEPVLRAEELSSITSGVALSSALSVALVGLILWLAFRSFANATVAVFMLLFCVSVTGAFAALAYGELNLISIAFAVLMVGLGNDYALHTMLRADEARRAGHGLKERLELTAGTVGFALFLSAGVTALAFLSFAPTAFIGMAQLGVLGAFGIMCAFLAAFSLIPAGLAIAPPMPPGRPPGSGMFASLGSGLAGHRNTAAAAILVAVLLSLAALPFARFDTDPMNLRDPDAPSVRAFAQLVEEPQSRPFRASILAEDLDAAEAIAEKARELPGVESVTTAASFFAYDADDNRAVIDAAAIGILPMLAPPEAAEAPPPVPDAGLRKLEAALDVADPTDANRALRIALANYAQARVRDPAVTEALTQDVFAYWPPLMERLQAQLAPDYEITPDMLPEVLRQSYLAADGRARVEIAPEADLSDPAARADFVARITETFPQAAGPVINVQRAGEAVARAILLSCALALGAAALLLLALTRDPPLTAVILFPVIASGLLTVALGVIFNVPFNYANAIALPLLIGAVVDAAVHFALRAKEEGDAAAVFSSSTPRAVIFAALTSIAAFGTLILNDHRGVASIGALLIIAMSATLACTLVLQPAAIDWLNARRLRRRVAAGLE